MALALNNLKRVDMPLKKETKPNQSQGTQDNSKSGREKKIKKKTSRDQEN